MLLVFKRFAAFIFDYFLIHLPIGAAVYFGLRGRLQIPSEAKTMTEIQKEVWAQLAPVVADYGLMYKVQLVIGLLFLFYRVLLETGPSQASLGQRLFRLRVLGAQGASLTFKQGVLRSMPLFIWTILPFQGGILQAIATGIYVGFIFPNYNNRTQGFHDIAAKAQVIHR